MAASNLPRARQVINPMASVKRDISCPKIEIALLLRAGLFHAPGAITKAFGQLRLEVLSVPGLFETRRFHLA